MAKPGPKAGWKRQQLSQSGAEMPSTPTNLTFEQRSNPAMLQGDDLRHLAYRLGMAKSELSTMDDAKIRFQLKYLINRQYSDVAE